MSSYDVLRKGHSYGDTPIRGLTNASVEGIGVMDHAVPDEDFGNSLQQPVGADSMSQYEMRNGKIIRCSSKFNFLLCRD